MKSSKKIEVSKASLVSLKAELSRKQEEVNKAKLQGTVIQSVPRPKKQTIWTKKNPGVSEREEKDLEQQKEEEDILKKSRAVLEAKTELYNKLSQSSTGDNNRFLVDFLQKVATDIDDPEDAEFDCPSDSEEEWVDYTDCLGRTRSCLKVDLDYIKEKDQDLFRTLGGFVDRPREWGGSSEIPVVQLDGEPELLSADMRREMMRQKWEQQEEVLRGKTDIHYQDVLFDEARSHGVGYFQFSQDEALRRTQQEALNKLRQETQREQEASEDARERRRFQLQARLQAARRRKRERMGLPPEEEEPEVKEAPEEEQKPRSRPPSPEPPVIWQRPLTPEPPKIRPWDIGKEGVREVMSQEDWVSKKRTERPQEFAPPPTYQPDFIPTFEQPVVRKPVLFFSSKKQSAAAQGGDDYEVPQHKMQRLETPSDHYASSSSMWSHTNARWGGADVPPPGVSDYEIPFSSTMTTRDEEARGSGTEIPPPPTFDYYGPSAHATRWSSAQASDLESSITAGLKYLRKQAEDRDNQHEKGLLDIM